MPAPGAPGAATVYASWNGATEVASWQVLVGPSATALKAAMSTARTGFETAIPVAEGYGSFQLQALDSAGRVIGTSRPFTPRAAP